MTPSPGLWPLVVYFILVMALVGAILGLSAILGERHSEPGTGDPYESGIVPAGTAHVRFGIQYYLIAAFFVIFDLESAFIYAWAIAARQAGWIGYAEVAIFIGVLVASLIYVVRLGALDAVSRPRLGNKSGSH